MALGLVVSVEEVWAMEEGWVEAWDWVVSGLEVSDSEELDLTAASRTVVRLVDSTPTNCYTPRTQSAPTTLLQTSSCTCSWLEPRSAMGVVV